MPEDSIQRCVENVGVTHDDRARVRVNLLDVCCRRRDDFRVVSVAVDAPTECKVERLAIR